MTTGPVPTFTGNDVHLLQKLVRKEIHETRRRQASPRTQERVDRLRAEGRMRGDQFDQQKLEGLEELLVKLATLEPTHTRGESLAQTFRPRVGQ